MTQTHALKNIKHIMECTFKDLSLYNLFLIFLNKRGVSNFSVDIKRMTEPILKKAPVIIVN